MDTIFIVHNCMQCPFSRLILEGFLCDHPKTDIKNTMDSIEASELPTNCPLRRGNIEIKTQEKHAAEARAKAGIYKRGI